MKHSIRTLAFTAVAAFLVLIAAVAPEAIAQNESGRRPLYKEGFQARNAWYDSSVAMYQYAFPIIRSLPPLNSSMPWDVMAAYIVADSLARFDTNGMMTETWLNSRHTMNDTLAGMLRFLYRMDEYNAITFEQYRMEVDLKRGSPRKDYRASMNGITFAAQDALLRCAPNRAEAGALYSSLFAAYVLRVKVLAVDSMPLKPRPGVGVKIKLRATVEILDTLKGGVIPSCQQDYRQDLDKKDVRRARIASAGPCTYITYSRLTTWDPADASDRFRKLYYARDPAFCMLDSAFIMYPGQEAVVFLDYENQKFDSTHDHFDLEITPMASFGALPIIDGRVRDVNHVWSSGLWMDYSAWRQRFLAIREKIITGHY